MHESSKGRFSLRYSKSGRFLGFVRTVLKRARRKDIDR
jgi:hypothetical protein